MITNERQYRITRSWLERFEQARDAAEGPGVHPDPLLRQALRDQYQSQVEELREQLAEYEALREGHVSVLELDSLDQLPEALIRARTAAGLSQKQLAQRLGLKEQQVQRYESTRYAGVSLERIAAVADALGAKIREQVVLPAASASGDRAIPDGGAAETPLRDDVRLAGALTRAGLTHEDLATRLEVPSSFTLKLQRGRVEPDSVPARFLGRLGEVFGMDADEARALVAPRAVPAAPAYAYARTRGRRAVPRAGGRPPAGPARAAGAEGSAPAPQQGIVSFREALENSADLTEAHRRAWLGAEADFE